MPPPRLVRGGAGAGSKAGYGGAGGASGAGGAGSVAGTTPLKSC